MVFHWSLSDSKSPQVSRTLLSYYYSIKTSVNFGVKDRVFYNNK